MISIRRGKKIKKVILLILLIWNVGLVSAEVRTDIKSLPDGSLQGTPTEILTKAEIYFKNREYETVLEYIDYLKRHPEGIKAERIIYMSGVAYFNLENYTEATKQFSLFSGDYPESEFIIDAKEKLGAAYLRLKSWGKALQIFRELLYSHPDEKAEAQYRIFSARALSAMAKYNDAAEEYKIAYKLLIDLEEKMRLDIEIRELIDTKINWQNELAEVVAQLAGIPAASYSLLRLAEIQYEDRDYISAYVSLKQFQFEYPNHENSEQVEERLKEIFRKGGPRSIKIASILPLSGEAVGIGRKILNGIQLAFSDVTRNEGINFFVKDSSGKKGDIKSLVEELSMDQSVVAVIGPVFSSEVLQGIPVSQKWGILMFSPTAASPDLLGLSPYFFRNCLTPKNEAEYMAEIAVDRIGLWNLAVLYQNDSHGIELKNSFVAKVEELGGEVIKRVTFDKLQNDFGKQIRAIGGMSDKGIKRLLARGDSLPNLNYDGLYIAGEAERVGLILPQLAFYNIENIPILGSSSLNSPHLLKNGGAYAMGVMFPDGFFPGARNPKVKNFVKKYQIYYNEDPDIIAAQAYDVASILIKLIREGAVSRDLLIERLETLNGFDGITGKTTFDSTGDAKKSLYLLTVRAGKIHRINEEDLEDFGTKYLMR